MQEPIAKVCRVKEPSLLPCSSRRKAERGGSEGSRERESPRGTRTGEIQGLGREAETLLEHRAELAFGIVVTLRNHSNKEVRGRLWRLEES